MQKELKITIDDRKTIQTVQLEFNELFPYLKLEFFSGNNTSSNRKLIKSSMATLGECRSIHNSGIMLISSEMTVAQLEHDFNSHYGLAAQVFRKSGRVWLETTVTDSWTLEKQNHEGEELSRHFLSDDRNKD